ncbi:hypothetical protein HHUSO_G16347 [Huso huso]|uniref:Uncharacterized protein n=1 Tax=Huso huso TaxID=61971 RepID=A0ABR0ZBG8_HUSHU
MCSRRHSVWKTSSVTLLTRSSCRSRVSRRYRAASALSLDTTGWKQSAWLKVVELEEMSEAGVGRNRDLESVEAREGFEKRLNPCLLRLAK